MKMWRAVQTQERGETEENRTESAEKKKPKEKHPRIVDGTSKGVDTCSQKVLLDKTYMVLRWSATRYTEGW